MSQARVVQVIATDSLVGDGTDANPFGRVLELWTLDGRLVASYYPPTGDGHATGLIGEL